MKTTEQQHNARKKEMMEKCFDCYAENGLTGTGIKALADACGCTKANLYSYFKNLDELIIESTAYCMEKVEDDFMEMAPTDPKDVRAPRAACAPLERRPACAEKPGCRPLQKPVAPIDADRPDLPWQRQQIGSSRIRAAAKSLR